MNNFSDYIEIKYLFTNVVLLTERYKRNKGALQCDKADDQTV